MNTNAVATPPINVPKVTLSYRVIANSNEGQPVGGLKTLAYIDTAPALFLNSTGKDFDPLPKGGIVLKPAAVLGEKICVKIEGKIDEPAQLAGLVVDITYWFHPDNNPKPELVFVIAPVQNG